MSLVPQQQRMPSLWILKGLITISLSEKKLDLLQWSWIFCNWRIYFSYETIPLWNPRNSLHRNLWSSLSDQRPLSVLVFAFPSFIADLQRGFYKNGTDKIKLKKKRREKLKKKITVIKPHTQKKKWNRVLRGKHSRFLLSTLLLDSAVACSTIFCNSWMTDVIVVV